MIVQYTAAALASENKVLAHPASADSIPTRRNQEDHVSMGAIAARARRQVLEHVERIVGIELLCAAQALDLRLATFDAPAPAGRGVAEAHARVRARIRRWAGPGAGPDLAAATALVHDGRSSTSASRRRRGPAFGLARLRAMPSGSWTSPTRRVRADPAVRGSGLRPSVVRLLGGRRPRVEGGARSWLPSAARPRRAPRREPVRPPPRPANPFAPSGGAPTTRSRLATGRGRGESLRARRRPARRQPVRADAAPRRPTRAEAPRKLQLLGPRAGVFGSYAKVLWSTTSRPRYAQFGPLSAYPRAQRTRDLYPQLPDAPLPAVITCIATTRGARARVTRCARGGGLRRPRRPRFSAIETYPEHGRPTRRDERGDVEFWRRCGFASRSTTSAFPVVRREL
jgi:hypothetical protein